MLTLDLSFHRTAQVLSAEACRRELLAAFVLCLVIVDSSKVTVIADQGRIVHVQTRF